MDVILRACADCLIHVFAQDTPNWVECENRRNNSGAKNPMGVFDKKPQKYPDHNWVKQYVYEDDKAPLLPKGTILHVIGFSLVFLGVSYLNVWLVLLGGVVQEFGHFYQYWKTSLLKHSPLTCVKPQSLFAYPIFLLIILGLK